jgi:hypothetical protein
MHGSGTGPIRLSDTKVDLVIVQIMFKISRVKQTWRHQLPLSLGISLLPAKLLKTK